MHKISILHTRELTIFQSKFNIGCENSLISFFKQPFQRFVQSGRVAYVSDGPYKGKLVTIVDIIDQNRVRIFFCLNFLIFLV